MAWIERMESKLTDWPLIIGLISGVFIFIPFFQGKELSKSGKYIPPGQLFSSDNTTMVDDYEAYGYYSNIAAIVDLPTYAEFYFGAVWLCIPTATDTLIDILTIVATSLYRRDFSVLSRIHVYRSSDESLDIVRLTHLERLLFTVGIMCFSFPTFMNVRHLDYAYIISVGFSCFSNNLTITTILNFLQRSSPTYWRPIVTVPMAVALCLAQILSYCSSIEYHFVGIATSRLLLPAVWVSVVSSLVGCFLFVATCMISGVQYARKDLRTHARRYFSYFRVGAPVTTTPKSREAFFRDLVVGVHLFACLVNVVLSTSLTN